jgi:AraC-like DNA-binding protein
MSRTRQSRPATLEHRLIVRSLAVGYTGGLSTGRHRHDWPQLVFASEGVLAVTTEVGDWIVPPQRAVWVPAGVEHELVAAGRVRLSTLYLRPDLSAALPTTCCVLSVTALLRELILRVIAAGYLRDDVAADRRLAGVLADQIDARHEVPLQLTLPTDARARRVADRVQSDPGDHASVTALALGSGASARTIERLFRVETGMSFGAWRTRARLLAALRSLAAGQPVTAVALAVGYDSTSAFIAMFRRHVGVTPGRYFAC